MLDLSVLNPEQKKAVEQTDSQVLILAGAGSGKTKTLMYRIANILQQRLATAEELLVVTFTNKAAGEMKERIADLMTQNNMGKVGIPWMGTFHSICVKILRSNAHLIGFTGNFSIYDTDDQLNLIKEVMDKLKLNSKDVNPRAVLSFISAAKNEMISPLDYAGMAQGYFQELVGKIFPIYQEDLKANNAMDFDDLIGAVITLLKSNPSVLKRYSEQFKYIMVDEYQDTNRAQYQLINMFAQSHMNLCAVGDDDQSIYAFRGATIRNILDFERDYPSTTVIKLEQNYRSTKKILSASFDVVSKNQRRKSKQLWTENVDGEKIIVYTAENEHDESRWVAQKISDLYEDGIELSDIAILYRTNAQSRSLEEYLLREAVNYKVVGGLRFYERKEVKDVLAYLRIIFNERDDSSLKRIINVPRRGIGAKAIADLIDAANDHDMSAMQYLLSDVEEGINPKLSAFAVMIAKLCQQAERLNIVDLINLVIKDTGYLEMLQDGTLENESRIENIKELISVATKFAGMNPAESLTAFLEEVALFEGEADEEDNNAKVTLMTVHAAKGLEFSYVFVVGMEEGLFPHSRVYTDPRELEEERRLAYVAITRAKHQLYLTHAESRVFFGKSQANLISRFIEDIKTELIELRSYRLGDFASGGFEEVDEKVVQDNSWKLELEIGDRIRHDYFGIGVIQDVEEGKATVSFGPIYGTKEIVLEFAPIGKI